MTSQTDLVRALNLVPYFAAHPDHTLFEAAANLQTTYQEIVGDLKLLHTAGVGMRTEQLIDLAFNENRTRVDIFEDQGMIHASRLTIAEAGALLILIESLAPRLADPVPARGAAAKLRAAMRGAAGGIAELADGGETSAEVPVGEAERAVRDALAARRQVAFRYWNAARDDVTERLVDPVSLSVRDGQTYLVAWDDSRGAHRTFRLDRMDAVRVTEQPAEGRAEELPADPFALEAVAEVLVHPEATWLAHYVNLSILPDSDQHAEADRAEADRGQAGEESGDRAGETPWYRAELRYGSMDWLVRYCLAQSDRLRLVGPPEAVTALHRRAARAATGYDEAATPAIDPGAVAPTKTKEA